MSNHRSVVAASLALLLLGAAARAGVLPIEQSQLHINASEGGFTGTLGPNDVFGSSVAVLGDLDGNGFDDLAVGAPGSGTPPGGAVWILFRASDGTVESQVRLDASTTTLPLNGADGFGRSLALLGDLDDDGNVELAVGADNWGPSTLFGAGAVFVLTIKFDGSVAGWTQLSEGVGGVPGPATFTGFGNAVAAAGDFDDDGVMDVAVTDTSGAGNGQVIWLLALAADGTALSATPVTPADPAFGGLVASDDRFGAALACVADLDGDGTDELAIGAPTTGAQNKGAVWLAFLQPGPVVASAVRITADEDGLVGPLEDAAWFGASLACADVDGDGLVNLVVGTPFGDNAGGTTTGSGGAWILDLDVAGLVTGQAQIADASAAFAGPLDADDQFGTSLALLPDTNGSHSIVAGARGDGGSFVFAPGAVWVLDLVYHEAWTNLGNALAGIDGEPLLEGHGLLTAGSAGSFELTHAAPGVFTTLIIGFFELDLPLKGGIIVPSPDLLILGLPTNGAGEFSLPFLWPAGLPGGLALYFQSWIPDATGPLGFAASNGLRGVTP